MTNKLHRIRVRALDGKPRDKNALNQLKSKQLQMPHLDIVSTDVATEFIIAAAAEKHIEQVRGKLSSVGLEEVAGGDTTQAQPAQPNSPRDSKQQKGQPSYRQQRREGQTDSNAANTQPLPNKPYAFVSLPKDFTTTVPVWHDGTSSVGRLSGEVRFELETLTPLLVGWERGQVGDAESEWPVHQKLNGVELANKKSVLCPLRAPWGKRPVIIPSDSLKGLLRHELGALLGAPMERVAERSYSYRPNALFPNKSNPRLIARIARVPERGVTYLEFDRGEKDKVPVRVPSRLELLKNNLKYDKKSEWNKDYYRFDDRTGAPYRGGQGAGVRLNSKRELHQRLAANPSTTFEVVDVPEIVQKGYLATLRHLVDLEHGHFSKRHPDIPNVIKKGDEARERILEAAEKYVFQPGDLIWVEWDTKKKCIVSFGWHYYYRWAYVDTVRRKANSERYGLFPLPNERKQDDEGAPMELSPVRRLFGYTGDNEGSANIGKGDYEQLMGRVSIGLRHGQVTGRANYEQLMGRVSINAALEVVGDNEDDAQRFLPPTFLKELGMPRPSAVEFYLKQPYYPNSRPSDQAKLVTYGDAAGYDAPGELAGRKFYLDREDAYTGKPWEDNSSANRKNERSTLALEASKPGRKFRFTLRFRDLDPAELAAILVALCPNQFRQVLGGNHPDGYCSKLGYARPLGWGSVLIEAKALLFLQFADGKPELKAEQDIVGWVKQHHQQTETQAGWLAVHRCKHPNAADYPRENGEIYSFHTSLRAEHSRLRRYQR